MTDNERFIAVKFGAIGYCLSSALAVSSIALSERRIRKQIKQINTMKTLFNGFVKFVNEKPVEMAWEDFIQQACERLNFIAIASNEMMLES